LVGAEPKAAIIMSALLRLLHVEDNPSDADLCVRLLIKGGYALQHHRVETKEDLSAALTRQPWDVIISDYRLPRFSAPEALAMLQQSGLDIPFIVVSGTIGEDVAVSMMKAGVQDYLMKANLLRLSSAVARVLSDVQNRRQREDAERALEASQQLAKATLDGLSAHICLLDARGDIVSTNAAWRRFAQESGALGTGQDGSYLHACRKLLGPNFDPTGMLASALAEVMAGTAERFEHEFVCGEDADKRWFLVRLSHAGGEDPLRVVVSHTEVTARRHAEAERIALAAKLRDSQKMEALGVLAGGIAHDFNNILSAILANVWIAQSSLSADHPANKSILEIHGASQRAVELVRQILMFSRRQPATLHPVSLGDVAREAARLVRSTARPNIDLNVEVDEHHGRILGDATQLHQVVMNLLTNACRAVDERSDSAERRGRVELKVEHCLLDGSAVNALRSEAPAGPYCKLSVADDGVGMDAATRERIFEPFYTTRPTGHGTGLGLAVVHGIVASHHGILDVRSRPGQGSQFEIYFPIRSEPKAVPRQKSEWLVAMPPRADRHVMYIDDEPRMLDVAIRLLQLDGYRVSGYVSPVVGLAALRDAPDAFDVLVTDHSMTELSGVDVAREALAIRKSLPVVIMSSLVSSELRKAAADAGAAVVLSKVDLVKEISAVIARVTRFGGAPAPSARSSR
jgi:signal transduction histidine kinase